MKKRLFAAILLIALLLVPIFGTVGAQQSGQGLEISPPLVDEQVDPGQSIVIDIRVRNITETEVIANGEIDDFVAGDDEDGQPKILVGDSSEPSPYTFKPWVSQIPSLRLAPREIKTAQITINVPQDASPGGHYGVVRFTAQPVGLDETGVSLSASIGTLVLLNVSGDVRIQGSVEQFSISQDGKQGTFFEKGPLDFTERINNTGNVHFKPTGTIKITDTFGKEVASLNVNESGGNILPSSIRKFEQTLDKTNMFGRYKAVLSLTYGDNQTLDSEITFWVVPYKMVLAVLGGLILLILIIVFLLKRYRKHVAEEIHREDDIKHGHSETAGPGGPAPHEPGAVHKPTDDNNEPPAPTPPAPTNNQ